MPRPDAQPLTRAVVVRGIGFGLAIALGAVAVWLIVEGTSQMQIRLGALAGFWGIFLGASIIFGTRRHSGSAESGSSDLAVRASGGLEPAAQAEARRAFEERLEHLLRTEIGNSVGRELGDLRREVASLRKELLDKVGGELRLERIETTRLIGSDLEALQREVRQLKSARDTTGTRTVVESATIPVAAERVAAAEHHRAEQAAREQAQRDRAAHEQAAREQAAREQAAREQAQRDKAAREQAAREQAAREQAERDKAAREKAQREQLERAKAAAARSEQERLARAKAERDRLAREQAAAQAAREQAARKQAAADQAAREQAQREQLERDRAAAARSEQDRLARADAERERLAREQAAAERVAAERSSAAKAASDDPFASLPRITPFTDFELDPIEPPSTSGDGPGYTGRRRAGDADSVESVDTDAGRHSRRGADSTNGGRRRRYDEDDEDGIDLLTQLLSRGSADR